MPINTHQYHFLSCSAKMDNLLQPICTTTSAARFGDQEIAVQQALDSDWSRTANGKDFLCPLHSKESVDKPARAPRKAPAPLQEQ